MATPMLESDPRGLMAIYRDGLLDDVLPFWLQHALDHEYGGYNTALDRDGTLVDTDKGIWVQGRFAWLLGEMCHSVEKRDDWLQAHQLGINFLERHGTDPADGRMWFHVTRDGRPIRKRRYCFSESFAAIAFAAHARLTGSENHATRAGELLTRFVNHVPAPKFTDTRPTRGMGEPMITIVTAQVLRDAIGYEKADAYIDQAIDTIDRYFVKDDIACVMETVGRDGAVLDHFDGRTLNPGHAIEGAWFIMEEGRHRGDSQLIALGCKMLDWMWERGWDKTYGGMLYFVDVYGKPVSEYWHDMKFWWPQNEAIIATLLAWLLTGESRYAQWHQQLHDWAYKHFPDPEFGEWYGYLHRDGRISNTLKGNLWKGPFHLPRMQLRCWKYLEALHPECGSRA